MKHRFICWVLIFVAFSAGAALLYFDPDENYPAARVYRKLLPAIAIFVGAIVYCLRKPNTVSGVLCLVINGLYLALAVSSLVQFFRGRFP